MSKKQKMAKIRMGLGKITLGEICITGPELKSNFKDGDRVIILFGKENILGKIKKGKVEILAPKTLTGFREGSSIIFYHFDDYLSILDSFKDSEDE
jgi:hypothetical protein